MTAFAISIPFPPSKNASHGYGRGRVYRSKKYLDWIKEANAIYLQSGLNKGRKPIPGKFNLDIAYSDKAIRIDAQNIIDATCDWLQEVGIVKNDKNLRTLILQPDHALTARQCKIQVWGCA